MKWLKVKAGRGKLKGRVEELEAWMVSGIKGREGKTKI